MKRVHNAYPNFWWPFNTTIYYILSYIIYIIFVVCRVCLARLKVLCARAILSARVVVVDGGDIASLIVVKLSINRVGEHGCGFRKCTCNTTMVRAVCRINYIYLATRRDIFESWRFVVLRGE